MNIIQHGNRHKGTIICRTSCACGCVFEFDKNDPEIKEKIYPNGVRHYFIECPDCGNIFRLSTAFRR